MAIREQPIHSEPLFAIKSTIDKDCGLFIYELNYYEKSLNSIELMDEGERMIGTVRVKRHYISFEQHDTPHMLTFYTNIRDTSFLDEDLKASVAIVHGFGENSDIFLETALQFALNGFDVHLVDLRGFG